MPAPRLQIDRGLLLTGIAAFAGGLAFHTLGLPAPWLAGAMLVAAALSLTGVRAVFPGTLRNLVFIILGLQIGASFTWQSLADFAKWPLSLAVLALTVAALIASGLWFYRRLYGWSAPTAFFASAPGALSMTLALAEARSANIPYIAVVQCMRLFLLVALLPIAVTLTNGGALSPVTVLPAADVPSLVLIIVVGSLAGFLANRIGVPAGFLIGTMLANAGLHLGGIAAGGLPDWLAVPGFVLLGTMVGLRFQAISVALLKKLLSASLLGFAVLLVVSTTGAALATYITGIPLLITLLAFAPGGLEVMTILAFALGLNPAFVATHQLARYLGLSLTLPIITAALHRRYPAAGTDRR
jgi:membrane AbrB-like protein